MPLCSSFFSSTSPSAWKAPACCRAWRTATGSSSTSSSTTSPSIERGDVVVFHYPRDPEKSYIKRVIALPGDRLRIDHGRVFVNGKLLREPYVPPEYRDNRSVAEIALPPDSYYIMGDHRSISSDSRDFGPVERSLIYGKAVFVYWPARDAGVVH